MTLHSQNTYAHAACSSVEVIEIPKLAALSVTKHPCLLQEEQRKLKEIVQQAILVYKIQHYLKYTDDTMHIYIYCSATLDLIDLLF